MRIVAAGRPTAAGSSWPWRTTARASNPSCAPRLFQPFTAGEGLAGLGMGLYMARLIVESHGGSIRLRRTARAAAPASSCASPPRRPRPPRPTPRHEPPQRPAPTPSDDTMDKKSNVQLLEIPLRRSRRTPSTRPSRRPRARTATRSWKGRGARGLLPPPALHRGRPRAPCAGTVTVIVDGDAPGVPGPRREPERRRGGVAARGPGPARASRSRRSLRFDTHQAFRGRVRIGSVRESDGRHGGRGSPSTTSSSTSTRSSACAPCAAWAAGRGERPGGGQALGRELRRALPGPRGRAPPAARGRRGSSSTPSSGSSPGTPARRPQPGAAAALERSLRARFVPEFVAPHRGRRRGDPRAPRRPPRTTQAREWAMRHLQEYLMLSPGPAGAPTRSPSGTRATTR